MPLAQRNRRRLRLGDVVLMLLQSRGLSRRLGGCRRLGGVIAWDAVVAKKAVVKRDAVFDKEAIRHSTSSSGGVRWQEGLRTTRRVRQYARGTCLCREFSGFLRLMSTFLQRRQVQIFSWRRSSWTFVSESFARLAMP